MKMRKKKSRTSKRANALRLRATSAELALKKKLEFLGVHFLFQRVFVAGNGCAIADFYIPPLKLCIEVDGPYHLSPLQKAKDDWRDRFIQSRGARTIRITNDTALSITPEALSSLIGMDDPENVNAEKWPELAVGDTIKIFCRKKALLNKYRSKTYKFLGWEEGQALVGSSMAARHKHLVSPSRYYVKFPRTAHPLE